MAVLILTNPNDVHLAYVAEKLQQRGIPFVVFDHAQFPAGAQIALTCSHTGHLQHTLVVLGERRLTFDMGDITAVWDRRPLPPVVDARIVNQPLREHIERECTHFLDDVWHTLHCLWIPGPPSLVRRADHKVTQLTLAGQLGFDVPPTLITNNPEAFLNFYRCHAGRIVSKPFHTGGVPRVPSATDDFWATPTQPVALQDVGFAPSIRFCPVIFQAYVPKQVELRITVVGDEVFACEIHSQVTHRTRHDWRRYDLAHTPHYPHDLPEAVRTRCLHLVDRLGLCYGAIDMILTPDGRYVFLEINPSGQFGWIEDLTGLPISEAITNLLTAREGNPVEHGGQSDAHAIA